MHQWYPLLRLPTLSRNTSWPRCRSPSLINPFWKPTGKLDRGWQGGLLLEQDHRITPGGYQNTSQHQIIENQKMIGKQMLLTDQDCELITNLDNSSLIDKHMEVVLIASISSSVSLITYLTELQQLIVQQPKLIQKKDGRLLQVEQILVIKINQKILCTIGGVDQGKTLTIIESYRICSKITFFPTFLNELQ